MKKIFTRALQIILLAIFLMIFAFPALKILAEDNQDMEEFCEMTRIDSECKKLSSVECRKLLEKCDQYFQEKAAEIEKDISITEAKKKTLQNQIYILRKKIKKLDYQIYQNNLMIKDLNFQIDDTQSSIEKTSKKIEDSKKKLTNILRKIYEQDQRSMIEILLEEETLSDFFDNLVALETLNSKNRELLKDIKKLKVDLENQKKALDEEKGELERAVKIQMLQKQESANAKRQQEYYLKLTEAEYQKQLKEKEEIEKKAAEIRSRIFELIGVPKAPTFGEALEIAKYVETITGIRPAFLLAILTQESNIGKNVGQCYLTDPKTGEGIYVKSGRKTPRVMNPKRDVGYFLDICKELGRDPYHTLVSCPMSYGWGGAMGPGQFIPSTWVLYKDKIKSITGKDPDPWDIKDAFLATGIYLKDLGGTQNEWRAAMRYFSGATWKKYEEFYGNSVISLAKKYQADIEILEKQNQ
ncbi:lytic murein transglycosylase [bacterium]|nr:lytic murein transglycosylase [bacterium]